MTTPTDKPAFAASGFGPFPNGEMVYGQQGMTLREWYAGMALANCNVEEHTGKFWASHTAEQAFAIADAMLAQSQKPIGGQ